MSIWEHDDWRKWLHNKSLKNVIVLTSGTVLSQILPILFFPILSRLYTPSDYGVLGLFMGISMLLMVASNLQLNYAILIPKENAEALKVLMAGLHIIVFFTIISLVIVVGLGGVVSRLLASPELRLWLYFLPASVLFSGANVQLSTWFSRTGQFNVISTSRVTTSLVTIVSSLLFSFFFEGPGGLVISYLLGNLVSFFMLGYPFKRANAFYLLSVSEIKKVLGTYRNFPLYTLPTELLSNTAQQLPLFIFSMYSGVQSVGWFSRSRQILGLPINYISSSISEVYKQKASEAYRDNPTALRPLFLKALGYLFSFSIIPFLLIALFSPPIFAFVFGENWRHAGVFAQCLATMYLFKFVVSPLAFNFFLVNQQRLDFILHIIIIVLTSVALFIGLFYYESDTFALILFSTSYSFMYLIYGILAFRFSSLKAKR